MEIHLNCLEYLTKHTFIRNLPFESFVEENSFQIPIANYICYCVGLINEQRVVHAIRFLGQSSSPGVTSYFIEWFNTGCYTLGEIEREEEIQFESVSFWVHSGVALRKNFFLYEDRMSLMKSCFLYDPKRNCYYRIFNLLQFLMPNYMDNRKSPIYSTPLKISYAAKRYKKATKEMVNKKISDLQKSLKKLVKNHNTFCYLEKDHPRLFEEIVKIIN